MKWKLLEVLRCNVHGVLHVKVQNTHFIAIRTVLVLCNSLLYALQRKRL